VNHFAALTSLQVRLLGVLAVTVVVALATVALVARASTTTEFERYVAGNRQEMQDIAKQIAASTGDRLLVTSAQGRVLVDSSGELVGRVVSADDIERLGPMLPPPGSPARSVDAVFVKRGLSAEDTAIWTRPLPVGPDIVPLSYMPDDREQLFVSAVTRSLIVGVLVGGGVAVALALAFARGILRPVSALTAAARRMERGDLSQRVAVDSHDEIGQLARAFNAMADGLARTEQLRRTMVTDVAHELRTPLTNLRGYLEAVRDGVTEPRREVIESLYEEAMLLTHLVDDLQDLTLSESGRLTLHREAIDAHTLLTSAALALRPRACDAGIDLTVDVAPHLPRVEADPQRIGQVLRNLVANALQYTPSGGTVSLSARRRDDLVAIEVRDTGCGISAEHLPNVFERFYRADSSRARSTGGAGIGLAVVKQLVEAHGGTVGVTSVEGQGSCFSFELSAISCQLSAISYQQSAISNQRSAISNQRLTAKGLTANG
jgi:signal transduction histidine kinase